MLKKLFGGGLEKQVLNFIDKYLETLHKATQCLHNLIKKEEIETSYCIENLEREADVLRREIIAKIYEGAFLPYLRPSLCNFIEILEKAFEYLKICAFEYRYLNQNIYSAIKNLCIQVAKINVEMCLILQKAFSSLENKKEDIREKNLAIRVCEKKIDELKMEIMESLRNCEVCAITNFWEGKNISEFIEALVSISDVIEDASDYLYILELSLK